MLLEAGHQVLEIDGSIGEGGGQIVRSALTLSMITGKPIRLTNIRAKRSKPGLLQQHLTAIRAATRIANAETSGAETGSTAITFAPGDVQSGAYEFSVGTAGSTTLVLQTILLPLLTADGPSRVTLSGGTHNPFAPPFDFLERCYVPLLRRMGADVTVTLERHGFYPAGGGEIAVEVNPAGRQRPIDLLERGAHRARRARATVAQLPRHIAEREIRTITRKLTWLWNGLDVNVIDDSDGPGNVVAIEVESENVTEVFTAFGKVGRSAESVAGDAVRQCRRYLDHDAPVGEYLADQLVLPFALAGGGSFATSALSSHAKTHIDLIGRFLDVDLSVMEEDDGRVIVRVGS